MSEFLRSDGYGYAYRQFNAEACRAAFKEAEAMRETNEKYKLETPAGVAYGACSVNRIAAALDRVSQKSHMAETIKVENCGRADGEWVRRSDYEALRGEIARLEGVNRDLEERPQVWSDEAACLRLEEENAALRSQLALAESKRKPARHRPGEQVSVGWDPEGE